MTLTPTLVDVLERRARELADFPEQDSLAFDACSFGRLHREAMQLARALRARGLAGRPLLLVAPAGLDYVRGLLACLYAGVIAVPAYPPAQRGLSRARLRVAAIVADCRLEYALAARPDTVDPALGITTLVQAELTRADEPTGERNWPLDRDAPCLLQYTSGSTASPKGVSVSLRQLSANLHQIQRATRVSRSDVHVTWLPPYHDMGLLGGILMPAFVGAHTFILTPESFLRRPLRWLQLISEQRATTTAAPNFAFELCIRRISEADRRGLDLSSLRLVFNGAEPIHPGTLDAFARTFESCGFQRQAFYPCYGMAEATLFIAGGHPDEAPAVREFDRDALQADRAEPAATSERARRLVSCGQPAEGTRIRVVDPDRAVALADARVGEIWVSGPSVASGYWQRPEDTAAAFGLQLFDGDTTRYLRTGDRGFVLDGELYVTGRTKDLIIVRGQNHYPHDIERTVQALDPALLPGCGAAFGLPLGREERLVIVQELDHRLCHEPPEPLIERAVEAIRMRHELAVHAFLLVKKGSLAKTASGKVQRQRMQQAYLRGELAPIASWASRSLREAGERWHQPPHEVVSPVANEDQRASIARFLRERVGRLAGVAADLVDEHAPLARYGLDSLASEEITADLEQLLGRSLPPTLSYDNPTIAALAQALASEPLSAAPSAELRGEESATRSHVRIASSDADVSTNGHEVAAIGPRRDRSLAIVGMSCRFPGAPNLDAFWQLLREAGDAIREVPPGRAALGLGDLALGHRFGGFLDDIERFDAAFFGISAREAARMDPQQRIVLEQAWTALEHAGIRPSSLAKSDCGVFVGCCTSDYALLHRGDLTGIDADYGTGNASSVIANRLSYAFDLRGPSMTVDTACSSSLVALHLARQSLLSGETSMAIVAGVNAVLAPDAGIFLQQARALARDGRCKTFDRRADGFVRSEGCGVVVLKPLAAALEEGDRIYARIESSAVNQDGTSNGLMAPSGPAQERLLRSALERAGIGPDELDYIEAHGVGAPLADAVELKSLATVLSEVGRAAPCRVGSVKTNLGHLEAASGMAALIKTALALTHETIPAHLHLREPQVVSGMPTLPLEIPREALAWPRGARARYAGISAFGFGGTNAHVIVREAPASRSRGAPRLDRTAHALLLSAKHPEALRVRAADLLQVLEARHEALALPDLCQAANAERDHFPYRAGFVACDVGSLRESLRQFAAQPLLTARAGSVRAAWLFTGAPPAASAGRTLFEIEPVFRRELERCARLITPLLAANPLEGWLRPGRESRPRAVDEPVERAVGFPQTCSFLLQRALFVLLGSWGLAPDVVFGQGSGEYAAASAAGILSWDEALLLVVRRELLLASLQPGAVIRQTLHQFKAALVETQHSAARLPLAAATGDRRIGVAESFERQHWLDHLYAEEPRSERAALRTLEADVFVELSSGDGFVEASSVARADWLPCLDPDPSREHGSLMTMLARLYSRGVDIDWRAVDAPFPRDKLVLPTYPFQRERYWLARPQRNEPSAPEARRHPFLQPSAGRTRS